MNSIYLGDGVYLGMDSGQLSIAVNHHENIVAYLEPEAFVAMVTVSIKLLPYSVKAELVALLKDSDRLN